MPKILPYFKTHGFFIFKVGKKFKCETSMNYTMTANEKIDMKLSPLKIEFYKNVQGVLETATEFNRLNATRIIDQSRIILVSISEKELK